MAAQELALALAGEEAEVLALGALGDRQSPARSAIPRTSGLVSPREREAQPRAASSGRSAESMWVWSLCIVGGARQQRPLAVVGDPGVVAGDEVRGAERGRRARSSRRSAARRCSARTGSACGPPRTRRGSPRPPSRGIRSSRSSVRCGIPSEWASAAGADHRLRRAAAPLAVGAPVGPELQRHRDHLRPPLALEQRRDRRIDSAAEGDEDALADPRVASCSPGARRRPKGAPERVGAEVGGMPMRAPRAHRAPPRSHPGRSGRHREPTAPPPSPPAPPRQPESPHTPPHQSSPSQRRHPAPTTKPEPSPHKEPRRRSPRKNRRRQAQPGSNQRDTPRLPLCSCQKGKSQTGQVGGRSTDGESPAGGTREGRPSTATLHAGCPSRVTGPAGRSPCQYRPATAKEVGSSPPLPLRLINPSKTGGGLPAGPRDGRKATPKPIVLGQT